MNHLKRLAVSLILTFVLAASVFAGETNTPPACAPGETNTPPCVGQSVNEETPTTILGETNTEPTYDVVDLLDIGEAVLWALTLF
jgi:hypothetical protein